MFHVDAVPVLLLLPLIFLGLSTAARRAILRLASHTSAGGSPFRFDDADAAVFIVYLVICAAHLIYASALLLTVLIKCIQRVSYSATLMSHSGLEQPVAPVTLVKKLSSLTMLIQFKAALRQIGFQKRA